MTDLTREGVKKYLSPVMSATPTKVCKKGRPKIDIHKNSSCKFCVVSFTSGEGRASFSPSGRDESVGLILAERCGLIGFPLTRDEHLSERVCRKTGLLE